MWIEAITFFLGASILLYCVLAGADFGAGILEFFIGKKQRQAQREVIAHALAPVWEANHVWIILAVVILFNGFPRAFHQLSISFHIPLTIMLFGIVLRGCAFTFRHYDAVRDQSQKYYSWIFIFSSFLTPLTLGIVAGGVTLGRIDPNAANYLDAYVWPWLNWFSFSVGVFVSVLFAFLASVYMIGETNEKPLQQIFVQRARYTTLAAILSGLLVFVAAEWDGFHLIDGFFHDLWSTSAMGIATLLLYPLFISLRKSKVLLSRLLVALQVAFVLFGWFKLQYPVLIASSRATEPISIYSSAAPEPTLKYLLYALIGGSALIFPAMFYLLKVFKLSQK